MTSGRAAWLAAAAISAGCAGPAAGPRRGAAQAAQADAKATTPYASPARWEHHPGAPDRVQATLRLAQGSCVLTASGGQRWMVTPPKAAAGAPSPPRGGECRGRAEAASDVAGEDLVGILRPSAGSWLFAGESGAVYEARDALGAFTRVTPPPAPIARVVSAGARLLALSTAGRAFTWSDGAWVAAKAPQAPIFDAVLAEGGQGLALSFPEALFSTDDGGVSWEPAGGASPAPRIGAHTLGVEPDGVLVAQGTLEALRWDTRRGAGMTRSAQPIAAPEPTPAIEVERAASAYAIVDGRAVIDGDRYFEVVDVRREEDGEVWLFARGRIEGRLETAPLPWSRECLSIRIGASGRTVHTACVREEGDAIRVRLRRSDDEGRTWRIGPDLYTPDASGIGIAAAPDGAALVTGVCKEVGPGECRPGAPVVVRFEGDRGVASLASAHDLRGAALAPAFSVDGAWAYFLGQGAGDELAIFVSRDGGDSFTSRPLAAPTPGASPPPGPELEDDEGEEGSSQLDAGQASAIRPGEDGRLGITLFRTRGVVYVSAADDGRVLRVAEPPAADAQLSGFGPRVLAVDAQRDGTVDGVWESLDGGASWAPVPTTRAVASGRFDGAMPLACGAGGCLLGESVARVGWRGQLEQPPRDVPAADEAPERRAARTPIVCELATKPGWARIDHVREHSEGAIPTHEHAMRGLSVWSVMTVSPKTREVAAVSAMLPPGGAGEPRLVTRTLLGAVARGAAVATKLSHQVEGYAAARVRFTAGADGGPATGSPMRGLEIAWENWMDGVSGRRTLADAGTFEASDVREGATGEQHYEPGLLSVSAGGIFVAPHGASRSAFFLDAARRADALTLPSWPEQGLAGALRLSPDAVIADGKPIGVAQLSSGLPAATWLLAARSPGPDWSFGATAIAPEGAEAQWTYAGARIGVFSLAATADRRAAWAAFSAFRGDGTFGAPEPLGTQLDLADPPRPCTAAERARTPRLDAPLVEAPQRTLMDGTRHPVIVRGDGDRPIVLLTAGSVTHGPPASTCIAAWHATEIGGTARAIVAGDLAHSFLFRPIEGRAGSIEHRTMRCRYDASAPIPDAIWREPGTRAR